VVCELCSLVANLRQLAFDLRGCDYERSYQFICRELSGLVGLTRILASQDDEDAARAETSSIVLDSPSSD
jgi:hypothetical protein